MKLAFLSTIFAAAVSAAPIESELKIVGKPVGYDTGTMWYQASVTYSLEGYAPLTISADMEKGIYPTGAREIHKLGKARFLIVGGFSTGGGMYTTVVMIIAGQNGRLIIQDELQFTRDRRKFADRFLTNNGVFAFAFPPIPASNEYAHALDEWEITLKGKQYDVDAIEKLPLTKPRSLNSEMIVFWIDENGFRIPKK